MTDGLTLPPHPGTNMLITLLALLATLTPDPPRAHDFHVTYGRLAVEGDVAVLRIRFFRDDLAEALAAHAGRQDLRMKADAEVDGLFLKYLAEKFRLESGEEALKGRLLSSGEDEIDHEPAWWYLVQFDASAPIEGLAMSNTLLFELHDDQENMLKVVHFPDGTELAFTFSAEDPSVEVGF